MYNVKSHTVCRVYKAEGDNWEYTGKCGAIVLVADSNLKCHHLKLVDSSSGNMLWEQELYDNFNYNALNDWLHTFENDSSVIGLSFADEQEAKEFLTNVIQCKNSFDEKSTKNSKKAKKEGGKKKKFSINAKSIKKKFKGVTKMFKSEKETIVVGGPKNFRHASHIGWGADGFSITDLPDEWKRLFKKAGIKKSELKDQETAQYILGVISDAMNSQGMLASQVNMGDGNNASTGNSGGGGSTDTTGNVSSPNTNAPPPPPGMGPPPPLSTSHSPSNHGHSGGGGGGSSLLEELQQKKNRVSLINPVIFLNLKTCLLLKKIVL